MNIRTPIAAAFALFSSASMVTAQTPDAQFMCYECESDYGDDPIASLSL